MYVQITSYRICQQDEAPGFRPLNSVEHYSQSRLTGSNGGQLNCVDVWLTEMQAQT